MNERIISIRISITRYVVEDPTPPGVVEAEFIDVHGRKHCFFAKTVYLSIEDLYSTSTYPRPGVLSCEIIDYRRDESGQEIIVVDTNEPWYIASTDGLTQFEVAPASLVEWEMGRNILRPWNGIANKSLHPLLTHG
jgi:hypothetical protein